MSTEYVGNANIAPHVSAESTLVDTEIAASPATLVKRGVSLVPGSGILPAGTVLGQVSASKKYTVYNDALSNGTQTAVGVLYQAVDTGSDSSAEPVFGTIVIAGVLKNSLVSGADANAITDLNARRNTSLDVFIF